MSKLLQFLKFLPQYPRHIYYTLRGYKRINLAGQYAYMHKRSFDNWIPTDEIISAPIGFTKDGKPVYLTSENEWSPVKTREFYDEDGNLVIEYKFPSIARTN